MNSREFLGASTRTAADAEREEEDDLALQKRRATPGKLTWTLDADGDQPANDVAVTARVDRRAEPGAIDPEDGALANAFGLIRDARTGPKLPPELARRLAAELRVDIDRVRLHTDQAAAKAAAMLNARAFTIGDDIYFGANAYDPSSEDGIQLIAHEMAHVAENQRGASNTSKKVSHPDDQHEKRADEVARRFIRTRATLETGDPAEAVNFVRAQAQRVDLPHRAEMEQHFGTSLGFVETYTGEAAQLACRLMAAGAFAVRNVVALADPSPQRDTLMHELTHVMQRGFSDAPEVFERGSLSIGARGSAIEQEADLHSAQPTHAADANTIHREGEKPDPAQAQARVLQYCKTLTFEGPDKAKLHWGFKKGAARCDIRYYEATLLPFTGDTYAGNKTVKGDKADLEDAFNKKWADKVGEGYRLHRAPGGYIVTKGDAEWKETVVHVAIEDKKNWSDWVGKLAKLGANGKGPVTFGWPKGDNPTLKQDDPPTSDAELSDYRGAMRTAVATAYANGDGRFGLFYDEVCKTKVFTQKICGSIYEELVALSVGAGVDGAAATSAIPVWDKKNVDAAPILATHSKMRLDADGLIELAGEGIMSITETKAYKNQGGPSASDITKMGQYAELIEKAVPGYVRIGEGGPEPRVFNHCYYDILVPPPEMNSKNEPEYPAKVKGDLMKWMTQIGTAFKEPATPIPEAKKADPNAKYSAQKWSLNPPPDGSYEFKIKFNPELAFQIPAKQKTIHFDNPPVKVPGLKVSKIQAAVDDSHKLTSGNVTYGVEAADIKKPPETKPLTPLEGKSGGQADNKLTGLTSKLKNYLPVDVDAAIVDDGIEATIKLKKGTTIPSLGGFTLDGDTTEIKATYRGGGTLSLDAEIGLKHNTKDIKGKVKVEYDNGWGFEGKVTIGADVIPGVSEISAGVSKSPAGEWRIFADAFTISKEFGQIKLTGSGSDLEYNVKTGMFKADVALDADLGMFGKASGTAKIENNKLTKGQISYDSPELKYPAKSENPAISGTVGGTLKFNDGKFSGDIRGSANLNIKGLQKVAGEKGLGLDVDAHITDEGNFHGSIATKTDLQFGKHIVIPAPLKITLEKDGSVSGAFSIEVKNIKWVKDAKISCTADKDGIHVKAAHIEVPFGNEEKGSFWGKVILDYTDEKGLTLEGDVSYKIKEGMIATGKLKYNNDTHEVSLHLEVSEITLLDAKVAKKTLFSISKKIPVINIYGIGAYIDIGFDLAFDMGFKLGIKPEVDFVGFSLETGKFKEIEAKLKLLGNIYAELIGTPKLGIGIFVLDPSILAGGGGLKMPIVGRADINPTGTIDAKYQPDGGVSAGLAFDMNMTFGIHASLLPYAEFDVLSGLWNPKWEGTPIAEFDILPKKELFKLHVDLGDDMTKKTDAPETPGQNAAPEASGAANDEKFAQKDAAAADKGGDSKPAPVQQAESPSGGEDGPFSISGLLEKLKASVPAIGTAEKIFKIAKKVWDVIKPYYDMMKPLIDLIGQRIDDFMDLFDTGLPSSAADFLPWAWKVAKKVLNLAFGGLIEFVNAVRKMLGPVADFVTGAVQKAVADGSIGVKRDTYYIWRPWPWDDYNFMAACIWKLNIPGVIDLGGPHGPPDILLSPNGAVALGLYEVLDACGVPITYAGMSDIHEPYNDRWTGAGARG